ncbi:hypothetical protein D3C76_679550 [compost metagenome]
MPVHVFERLLIELQADRAKVDGLAADHARRTRRQGQRTDHLQADLGVGIAQARVEQGAERQALQAIAGEDRAGFIEFFVRSRLATTQIVVVHGRQIVVYQRIGVDQFHCAGRAVGLLGLAAQGFAGGVGQQRAHALAAIHHAVAHGFVQSRQLRARRGEQGFHGGVDAGLAGRRIRFNHSG